jgi:hypothetical protein
MAVAFWCGVLFCQCAAARAAQFVRKPCPQNKWIAD